MLSTCSLGLEFRTRTASPLYFCRPVIIPRRSVNRDNGLGWLCFRHPPIGPASWCRRGFGPNSGSPVQTAALVVPACRFGKGETGRGKGGFNHGVTDVSGPARLIFHKGRGTRIAPEKYRRVDGPAKCHSHFNGPQWGRWRSSKRPAKLSERPLVTNSGADPNTINLRGTRHRVSSSQRCLTVPAHPGIF